MAALTYMQSVLILAMAAKHKPPCAAMRLPRKQSLTCVKIRVASKHAAVLLQDAQSQLVRSDNVALHMRINFPSVLRVAFKRLACITSGSVPILSCQIARTLMLSSYLKH